MLRKVFFVWAFAAAVTLNCAGAFAADTPALDKREQNQQARIDQGVQSGELTRPEEHRLERSENRLQRHEDKAKSDGTVTPAERARLQHEANRTSKRIYRQKHDRQERAK